MAVCQIDPLRDPRWQRLLERHPQSSIFHTAEWLEVLQRTYGYEPVALTTTAPGEELSNGLVFCKVKSRLTGARAVSLPFSDHCEPLVETAEELAGLLAAMKEFRSAGKARYVEVRPVRQAVDCVEAMGSGDTFCFHQLDLQPSLEGLFSAFHKSCVQRKIRTAEREALGYEEGRTESLLQAFYRLMVLTRQRQGLPPQPLAWFRALLVSLGDRAKILVASKDSRPVASILTLEFKHTLVYKYGCSDKSFGNLGGMQLLFWKAIQDAKKKGLACFDMGRSDWDNQGLIDFKDRWGAAKSCLTYWRYPAPAAASAVAWKMRAVGQVCSVLPETMLEFAGRLLYRHVG